MHSTIESVVRVARSGSMAGMASVTLQGDPFHTFGELPAVGTRAPDFVLAGSDLSDVRLDQFSGRHVVLNIFPSVDTPTCASSVRTFNREAAGRSDAIVLCVSEDLPFAAARFCGAEGIDGVQTASAFRSNFGRDYGVRIVDGPLNGLMARAVVVLDASATVVYTQLVTEIVDEPDYGAALAAIQPGPAS